MSEAAEVIRDQRRSWATPGGSHDKLVRTLAVILPGAVGVLAAVMILAPLKPRGEVSFLLDRNKVATTGERIKVADAMYRGTDDKGQPFRLTAGSAVQADARVPVVTMNQLMAELDLADGPARLAAPDGAYDFNAEQVKIAGPVVFTAADGYRMTVSNVSVDFKTRSLTGAGGVSGSIPAGTFSADRIVADFGERTIALDGRARLRMVPGQMRMP